MRAVSVLIAGIESGDETLAVDYARIASVSVLQVRMIALDATINDRYADANSGIAEVDHRIGYGAIKHVVIRRELEGLAIRRNVDYVRVLRQYWQ